MLKQFFLRILQKNKWINEGEPYEFCPRCNATLSLQKGYSNDLHYWTCKGCGEMLINPSIEDDDGVVWSCDGCGAYLNIQPGFNTDCGSWSCTECGYVNKIDESEIYSSEDEYQASLNDPYKGLSDAAVLELSDYEEIGNLGYKQNVVLVKSYDDNKKYVKKYLKDYNLSVYEYLRDYPISHMPKIHKIYEGTNNLIVIEEYIEGSTLSDLLNDARVPLNQGTAINIAIDVCRILSDLHSYRKPIVHRDVKPSNIILSNDGEIYLLDMNVAKWYNPDEVEDTKLFATQYYAAPEQMGYGFTASSGKTDIYAVGVLLNELITGQIPKEEKATGPVWDVIEKCISFDPESRYTADELIYALETLER